MSTTDWPALPLAGVERHLCHATPLGAGDWEGGAGAGAAAQSQLGRRSAFDASRPHRHRCCPYDQRSFTMEFDFVDHQLITCTTDGLTSGRSRSGCNPLRAFMATSWRLLTEMSLPVKIWPVSVEMPTAVRLDSIRSVDHDVYDARGCRPLLARAPFHRARARRHAVQLRRKSQPRSLLLGRLRPCRDAVLGAAGATA